MKLYFGSTSLRSMITILGGCFPRFRGNFSYRCQKSSRFVCIEKHSFAQEFQKFFLFVDDKKSKNHRRRETCPLIHTILLLFRYGRRTILTLTTSLSGISGLIHSFSVNYWMFLAFEFIDATVAAGIYSAGFILGELITRQSKGRCWT